MSGRGGKFIEVCKINDKLFEGTIIRAMRRLEEFLKQMCLAAKVVGDSIGRQVQTGLCGSEKGKSRGDGRSLYVCLCVRARLTHASPPPPPPTLILNLPPPFSPTPGYHLCCVSVFGD